LRQNYPDVIARSAATKQSAKRHEVAKGNRGDLVFGIATLAFGRLAMTEKRVVLEKLNYYNAVSTEERAV